MAYDENLTQRKHKQWRWFRDAHGRRWGVTIDKRTNDAASRWEPQFKAPILPPQQYLRVSQDPEHSNRVLIDYENWRNDSLTAGKEYHALLMKVGVEIQGDSFDPSNPGLQVRQRVGSAPYPPVLHKDGQLQTPVIDACADGQEYVLGLRDFDPKNPEDVELHTYVVPKTTTRKVWGKAKEKAKADRDLKMQEA